MKTVVRTELVGGPQDGAIVETANLTWDVPIIEPLSLTPPSMDSLMRSPKLRVHRYQRTAKNRMTYEGIFKR